MRLLHTPDWHLGQTLHQFDRQHEHDSPGRLEAPAPLFALSGYANRHLETLSRRYCLQGIGTRIEVKSLAGAQSRGRVMQ